MYRCEICKCVSKPRQQLLRHVVIRRIGGKVTTTKLGHHELIHTSPTRTEIAKEIPCCIDCYKGLILGATIASVRRAAEQRHLKDRLSAELAAVGRLGMFK